MVAWGWEEAQEVAKGHEETFLAGGGGACYLDCGDLQSRIYRLLSLSDCIFKDIELIVCQSHLHKKH